MNDHDNGGDMAMANDTNAFCQGMGRVMMPGFQFSFDPASEMTENNSCILYLFPNALVNTAGKYAAAVIGTYLLALVFEFFRAGRAHFSKGEAPFQRFQEGKMSPLALDSINALAYIVQVTIAYWLMLLVMLYEAMIFIALVLGLGMGYFAILQLNRRYASKKEGSHEESSVSSTYDTADSPNQGSKENKKLDTTYTSISPCCADELTA
jgi:solute carrier family 31 (copper transporter), member 1